MTVLTFFVMTKLVPVIRQLVNILSGRVLDSKESSSPMAKAEHMANASPIYLYNNTTSVHVLLRHLRPSARYRPNNRNARVETIALPGLGPRIGRHTCLPAFREALRPNERVATC